MDIMSPAVKRRAPASSAAPRLAARALLKTLRAMPVTVVTGARQTGKTTLVQTLAPLEARA